MATKVHMEALSPTMEEGRLVKWNKKEGDQVKSGDTLAEVETDKAVMELVARADGQLLKVMVPEGTTVPVGNIVAWIGKPGEKVDGDGAGAPAKTEQRAPCAGGRALDFGGRGTFNVTFDDAAAGSGSLQEFEVHS